MSYSYNRDNNTNGGGEGCANGGCKTIRDVVSRPTLYSRDPKYTQYAQTEQMRQPMRSAPPGVGAAAAFTAPQPPPVNQATEFYGYSKGGRQSFGKDPNATPYSTPTGFPGQGQGCGCNQPTQQITHTPTSSASPFSQEESSPIIDVVGKLICLKCFGQDRRNHGPDHIDAQGKITKDCAKMCATAGNPVGLLQEGSGRAYVLLASSPNLSPYMGQRVHAKARVAGQDVGHSSALLLKDLHVQKGQGEEMKWEPVLNL